MLESESGSFLIEIVVSAALIGVVTIAVFAAFDGANAASGRNRAKSVATSLAEQDQERLKVMAFSALGNENETNTKKVGDVTYTIVSKGTWINETTGGSVSCTSGNKADYVKISSTVTWTNMRLAKPIEIDSIVAPPAGSGVLGLLVYQRDGITPQPGIPFTVSGPQTVSRTTDQNGCAFIGALQLGNYTIKGSLTGYTTTAWNVLADGVTPDPATLDINDTYVPVTGSTVVKQYIYDKRATVNLTIGGSGTADQVTFANTGYPNSGSVTVGKAGTQKSTYSITNVFPFKDAYKIYTGDCAGNEPSQWGAPAQNLQTDPGGTYSMTIYDPPMTATVKVNGSAVSGAAVKITPDTSALAMQGCSATSTTTTGTSPVGVTSPSMPFGQYNVCASASVSGTTRHFTVTGVKNNSQSGVTVPAFNLTGTSLSGGCP